MILLIVGTGFWVAGCDVGRKPAYVSTGRIMVTRQIRAADNGVAGTEEMANFFGTQLELMKSSEIKKLARIRAHSLHPDPAPDNEVELEVTQLPKTSIFVMRAIGKSENYVRIFLDACVDEYLATKLEMGLGRDNRAPTIQVELVRVEKEMRQEEEELQELTKSNNFVFLQEEIKATASHLAQLNEKMAELRMEVDLMDSLTLEQTLELSRIAPQLIAISSESSASALEYMKARMKLSELTYQRRGQKGDTEPKKTAVVTTDAEIARIEGLLKMYKEQWTEANKTKREGIGILAKATQDAIRAWEQKTQEITRKLAEYEKIKSKIERSKSTHARLMTSLRAVDMTGDTPSETVLILERATPAVLTRP